MNAVETRGLTRHFGDFVAVDGVELSISLRSLEDRLEILRLQADAYETLLAHLEDAQLARCGGIRRSRE